MTAREKLLDKLAKLKAHAESAAQIGSLHEAEAFAAALQRLLLQHKLAMTDVELAAEERSEPVGWHRIDYEELQLKKVRVAWSEKLTALVAKAHWCRIVVVPRSSRVHLVGRPSDCKLAEYMIVTLLRATERLADRAYAEFSTECVKECAVCGGDKNTQHPGHAFLPNWARCRGFRPAFIQHFVRRIGERYREALAQQDADSSGLALVRYKSNDAAIKDFLQGQTKRVSGLSTQTRANAEGVRRGRAAADAVDLRGRAVEGGSSRRELAGAAQRVLGRLR